MLQNKTIFITGATAGFGFACAKLFIEQGARVIATGRREDRLSSLRDEVEAIQPAPGALEQEKAGSPRFARDNEFPLHTLTLDVRDRGAVEKAIAGLPKEFSDIDVLVNNAGLALGLNTLGEQTAEDLEQMIDTNIKGVVHCTHILLPKMVARGRGHIVNLSSIAGTYPYPGGNVYGATKAFVTQFSLNLRADILGKNIRVTNIEPGMCDTEFSTVRFKGDKQKADNVYAGMTPLSADDIANTILWTISQPEHVNINRVEIMPTQQAFSPFAVSRNAT